MTRRDIAGGADGRGGFTLLEMLIAMLILVGGMVSVLALFSTSAAIHRTAVDDTRSAMIAEEAIDRIRTEWNEEGDLSKVQALDLDEPRFRPYRVSAEIASSGSGSGALAVVVRVAWNRARGERSATFETVVLRDGFGATLRALRSGRDRRSSPASQGGS